MKRFLFCLLILLIGFGAFAQEQEKEDGLSVKSFKDVSMVKQYARRAETPKDANGVQAALVLVQVLSESEIEFANSYKMNVPVEKKDGEYWVYMAEGAKSLEVKHPQYPKIRVNFGEVSNNEIPSLVSKCTYELVIDVPKADTIVVRDTIAETYQNRLAYARTFYAGWKSTTDPDYFLKARRAYEVLLKHNVLPPEDILKECEKEYDDILFMRKYTNLCHKAWSLADKWEKKAGYTHDSVYHWLIMAVKQTDKLVKKYPGGSFEKLHSEAITKRNNHPNAKEKINVMIDVERNSARGTVTQKVEYLPYNSIGIYATKVERPKKDDEKQRIGTVKSDRTYEVVMPDGFSYIIFDGEKEGHLVNTSNQEINVFIK